MLCMSGATIRIPRRDKERLERIAKKTGSRKLSNAFRFALSAAERETEEFHGEISKRFVAHKFVRSAGGDVSEHIDENLADGL